MLMKSNNIFKVSKGKWKETELKELKKIFRGGQM